MGGIAAECKGADAPAYHAGNGGGIGRSFYGLLEEERRKTGRGAISPRCSATGQRVPPRPVDSQPLALAVSGAFATGGARITYALPHTEDGVSHHRHSRR